MNSLRIAIRLALAWVALLAAQMVTGMVIHVDSPPMPDVMRWLMIANGVVVLALGAAALRSNWRNWQLALAMFVIPAAVGIVNMIEGVLFLTNAHIDWPHAMAFWIVSYGVAALLWLAIFRGAPVVEVPGESAVPQRSIGQMIGRTLLCSAIYVALYYSAGMIVIPYIRDFYATQHIPSMGEIVTLQFFLRGPVFMLLCILLVRMFRLPHLSGALAVGLAFTIVSGVAPLIVPNAYFPDYVRWMHFREVTSSNFVFGFVVSWIWGRTQRVAHLAHAHA